MPIRISSPNIRPFRADTAAPEAQYRLARDRDRSLQHGLAALTSAAAQILNVGERYHEQERLNFNNKTKILAHGQFYQAVDEWERGLTGENAMESVAGLDGRLTEIGTKLLENAPDDKTREATGMQLAMLKSTIMRDVGKKAHGVHVEYSAGMVDQALNDTLKSAYHSGLGGGGPADLTAYLDAVDTTVDAQAQAGYWLDPLTAQKIKRKSKSDIAKGFVRGGLDADNDATVLQTIGNLQAGRYNALDFEDVLVLGHAAAAARERIKNKREAEARSAAANAEDATVSKVYAAALSITSQGDRQDPGAAAALLYSPTAKELFKGVSDKTLAKAASWARSNWEIQKGRESEQEKDMADAATEVFEESRRKGELTHDKIEADPAVPVSVRTTYHNILDADVEKAAAKKTTAATAASESIAANLLSRVSSGEITRISEIAPYRAQGLRDDEFNTVVKQLETVRESKNKPWLQMADDFLKTVTKTQQNEDGVLEPKDVVRVQSIVQEELSSGKLEAKDILRRTQELTDTVYESSFWKSDNDLRLFQVHPGGQLPVSLKERKTMAEGVENLMTGNEEERALYRSLYPKGHEHIVTPSREQHPDEQAAPLSMDKGAADVVPEDAKKLIAAELRKAGKDALANDPETIRKVYEANKDKFKDLVK